MSTSSNSKASQEKQTKPKSNKVHPSDEDSGLSSHATLSDAKPSKHSKEDGTNSDEDQSQEKLIANRLLDALGDPTKANELVLDMRDHLFEVASDQLQRVQPSAGLSLFLTTRWNFQPHLLTWLVVVFLLGFAPYYAVASYSPGLLLVIPFGVGMCYALIWLVVYRVHAAAKFREQEENDLHVRMMGVATQQWSKVTELLTIVRERINNEEHPADSFTSLRSPTASPNSPSCVQKPDSSKIAAVIKDLQRQLEITSIATDAQSCVAPAGKSTLAERTGVTDVLPKVSDEVRAQANASASNSDHETWRRYLMDLSEIREVLVRLHQHDGHELGPDIPCHSCEIFPVPMLRRMAHTPLRGFTGYLLGTTQDAHGARLPAWAPVFIICGFFYIVGFLYVVEFRCAFIDWPTCGGLEELNYAKPCGGVQGISLEQYQSDLQIQQSNSSYDPNWPTFEGFPVVNHREWFSALLSKRGAYAPFYVTIAVCNSQFIFYLVGCLVISTVLAWSTSPSAAELIQQQLKHHIHDLQKEEKIAQLKQIQLKQKIATATVKDIRSSKSIGNEEKSEKTKEAVKVPAEKTENSENPSKPKKVEKEHDLDEPDVDSTPEYPPSSAATSSSMPNAKETKMTPKKNEKKSNQKTPRESPTESCSSESDDDDNTEYPETVSLLAPPRPAQIKDPIARAKATGSAIHDQSLWQQAWLQLMLAEASNLPGCRDMLLHSDGMNGMRTLVCDQEITTFVLERYLRERGAGIPNSFQKIEKEMSDDERRSLYAAALTYWMARDPFIAEYTSLLNMTGQQLKRLRAWGINWLDDIDEDQFSLRMRRRATVRASMRQEKRHQMRLKSQADSSSESGCLKTIHTWAQGQVRHELKNLKFEVKKLLSIELTIPEITTHFSESWKMSEAAGLSKQLLNRISGSPARLSLQRYTMSIIRNMLIQKLRGKLHLELSSDSVNESLIQELGLTDATDLKSEFPKLFAQLHEIARSIEPHVWPEAVKLQMTTMSHKLKLRHSDVLELLGDLEEEEQILKQITNPQSQDQVQREMIIKQEAEWVASNEQHALPSIASWNMASLIIAMVVGWFQPIWNITSNASLMHGFDIALNITSVLFNVPMLFLVCRTLRHPFLCYIESHYLMLGLMHTKLDLADETGHGLKVWKLLRHHLVHHRGKQLNGLAQWSLFISLSVGACLTLMIVLTILLGGSIKALFTSYDGLIQLIGAVGLLGFSFGMVKTAVGVWTTQQEHCRMLQEVQFKVSNGRFKTPYFKEESASFFKVPAIQKGVQATTEYFANKLEHRVNDQINTIPIVARSKQGPRFAEQFGHFVKTSVEAGGDMLVSRLAGDNSDNKPEAPVNTDGMTPAATAQCKAIGDLIDSIREHDVAPAAFGLQMKPTLLQVLYGYVGTAVVAIFSRYVVTSFT